LAAQSPAYQSAWNSERIEAQAGHASGAGSKVVLWVLDVVTVLVGDDIALGERVSGRRRQGKVGSSKARDPALTPERPGLDV